MSTQIGGIPLVDDELEVAASDNDAFIFISPLDINNDVTDNNIDVSAQVKNICNMFRQL